MEKLKILITGKNQPLTQALKNDISNDHSVMSVSFSLSDLTTHLEMVEPQLLIICLDSEGMDDIIVLDKITKIAKNKNISVFIAGSKEDCEYYNSNVDEKPIRSFFTPVSSDKLLSAIGEISMEKPMDDFDFRSLMGRDGHLDMDKVSNIDYIQNASKEQPLTRRRILVIDDSPIMLRLIKEQLIFKYDVAVAVSGKIAYKFLDKTSVNLILLDYDMPGESGTEVFKKLKENPKLKNVPIIFLTGVNDQAMITKALLLGPQGYLLKPVDNEKLLDTVQKYIG